MPTPEELKSGYVPEAEITKLLEKFETYAQTLQSIATDIGANMPPMMPAKSPTAGLAAIRDHVANLYVVMENLIRRINKLEQDASSYAAIDALMDGSDAALGCVFTNGAPSQNEDVSLRLGAQVMALQAELREERRRAEELNRTLWHVSNAARESVAQQKAKIKMRDLAIAAHERHEAGLTAENTMLRLACGLPALELPGAKLPWLSGPKGTLSASASSDTVESAADSAAADSAAAASNNSASGSAAPATQPAKKMRAAPQ